MKYTLLTFLVLLIISSNAEQINIVESTFKLGGISEEKIYYGFCEGDQLLFSFEEVNNKEIKEVEIIEYPSSSKFMDYKTTKVSNKTITINRTGIYVFRFSNSSLGGRVCKYKIDRIPASENTKDFNTSVYWKTLSDTTFYTEQEKYLARKEYVPKTIVSSSDYYINSGLNSTLQGGKSRITFPVILPVNTVEWFYQFSASRNKEDVTKTKGMFNMAGQLSTLIDQTGAISFGIDALTQPPGADFCDIYLLDFNNLRLFEAKEAYSYFPIGTRENIKSGIVKMQFGAGQAYYIGLKNPDSTNGVNVVIEVVAIVLEEEWAMRDIQKYNVKTWEEPYLK